MGVSEKTRKIVWAEAGGRCAICRGEAITPGTDCDDPSVFGEEAHLVARSKGGPRFGNLDVGSRHNHMNLLLLCSRHHKQIDDQPHHFTVERLREIKERHAAWVRHSLDERAAGGPKLVPTQLSHSLGCWN
ncbi:HNH endonuclease [Streptomyces sp. NPDC096934]|uniref:HNH endonuclease n=1 Tax=Streptomyces sp. NPDC096934 TaxID=3155551 RepID=UPI0033327112